MPVVREATPKQRTAVGAGAAGLDSAYAGRLDSVYRAAGNDPTRVPWYRGGPCRAVVSWLNAEAPALVRPGATAVVVGCGLGDDVAELCDRGYDAQGFDISPGAVQWARQCRPAAAERFMVADLLDLPPRLRRRFDLVVEAHTLESLPPEARAEAAAGLESLLRPHGTLLAVATGGSLPGADAWGCAPLASREFEELFGELGLVPTRGVDDFEDGDPPRRILRGAFRRA